MEHGVPFGPAHEALKNAARAAARDSLGLKKGERVLIITNPEENVSRISWALYDAASDAGAEVVLLYQAAKTQFDFCSLEAVAALKSSPDVCISLSAERMGKDREAIRNPYTEGEHTYDSAFHYLLYGAKTLRGFWSPRVSVESFVRAVPLDYAALKKTCAAVKEVLDAAEALKVTNKNGTDITLSLAGRSAFVDDGDFSLPGRGGNLPAGETFVSPALGSAEGVIVFDGSISSRAGEILIKTPIRARVRRGFVEALDGAEEARELLETLRLGEANALTFEKEGKLPAGQGEVYSRNVRNIGELGIGLNPNAKITGNMLEDEKVARTCHFAIGSNYDDDAPALIHLDGLVSEPDITAIFPGGEKKLIMENGELTA